MKILSNKKYKELEEDKKQLIKRLNTSEAKRDELQAWILKLIEAKGFEIDKVPYILEKRVATKYYDFTPYYCVEEKIITIPEIRISQSRAFRKD